MFSNVIYIFKEPTFCLIDSLCFSKEFFSFSIYLIFAKSFLIFSISSIYFRVWLVFVCLRALSGSTVYIFEGDTKMVYIQ
jgi:hypothetical protein